HRLAPREYFLESPTGSMSANPDFEVFGSVIKSHTVAVMDRLVWQERTAKNPLHHEPMLWDLPAFDREHAIAVLVDRSGRPGGLSSPGTVARAEALRVDVAPVRRRPALGGFTAVSAHERRHRDSAGLLVTRARAK